MTSKHLTFRSMARRFFVPEVRDDDPAAEPGPVRGAAWLSADTLLVVAVAAGPDRGTVTDASSGARSIALEEDLRLFVLTSLDADLTAFDRMMGVARRAFTAVEVAGAIVDVSTLVREHLAGLAPAARVRVRAFLSATLGEESADPDLLGNLNLIRDALRERLPYCEVRRDQPQGLHIDHLMAVDARSFYVRGWLWDGGTPSVRLTAESPEGSRAEILDSRAAYPRPDVVAFYEEASAESLRPGFISYFQTPAPSHLPEGWVFEVQDASGVAVQKKAPTVVRDILTVRNRVLEDILHRDRMPDDFLDDHLFPALTRLQERYRETVDVVRVEQYGMAPPGPDVSVIVPLYKRIDFLEQQLAQFALDPDLFGADLMYVLDSPEQADELAEQARQLVRLYRVPFRVVFLNRNGGFSAANNVGASLARGRLLLLLNSDVLPDRPGWLRAMAARYDATPGIGALGPKLLYEDDTLQHAGMYFDRPDGEPEWENMHYFKGLHRRLPAANVRRPVPAVTAACLMVHRDIYEEVGGLHGHYVQGDYEDSDLCLRLLEAGYERWYDPEIELYHLEGQSYPGGLRRKAMQYNRWLHTRLWNERIERLMAAEQRRAQRVAVL